MQDAQHACFKGKFNNLLIIPCNDSNEDDLLCE